MANELKNTPRRRGPMGPGMGGAPAEKAKDFKVAMKRLFSELKKFRILIIIALLLATLGAILSISAPNRLSKLTDEISKGLAVNSDNLETLGQQVITNFDRGIIEEIEIDGTKISVEDQMKFLNTMKNMEEEATVEKLYEEIDKMPESIQDLVKPFMNMEEITKIALFLATIYIASALFTFIQSICMTDVSNKFAKVLRTRISVKINSLPLRYFDKN